MTDICDMCYYFLAPINLTGQIMVDITWHGQACFRIKGRTAAVVIDPYDAGFTGLKPLKLEADIVCVTHSHQDHNNTSAVRTADGKEPFIIAGPGGFEKLGVNIVGVASFHDNSQGSERGNNTIYNVTVDDVNIVHLGDLGQKKLSQEQVEQLSSCDVLLIPTGGTYTIEAKDAPDIIAQIEPKIVIPMHHKIGGLKFPLDPVDKFLSAMGKEKSQAQNKLSLSREKLPEELDVVLLEVQ